jgi:pilus assembly protein CpaC
MTRLNVIRSTTGAAIAGLLLAGAAATPAEAAGTAAAVKTETPSPVLTSRTENGPALSMVVNKSTILRLDVPAVRISVGNPAVADITPISSREVIVLGKTIGTTNLIIWDKSGVATMRDVIVTPEPVIAAPPPPSDERDSVEVIKGLNKSKMEF